LGGDEEAGLIQKITSLSLPPSQRGEQGGRQGRAVLGRAGETGQTLEQIGKTGLNVISRLK